MLCYPCALKSHQAVHMQERSVKIQPAKLRCCSHIWYYSFLLRQTLINRNSAGLLVAIYETSPLKFKRCYAYTHLINTSSGLLRPSSETRLLNGERLPLTPRKCTNTTQRLTNTNVTTPTKSQSRWDPSLPTETIKDASKECHEDAPRWWNKGVSTLPFKACRLGFSIVPGRMRSSDLFFCRAWIVLVHSMSWFIHEWRGRNVRSIMTSSAEHDSWIG